MSIKTNEELEKSLVRVVHIDLIQGDCQDCMRMRLSIYLMTSTGLGLYGTMGRLRQISWNAYNLF